MFNVKSGNVFNTAGLKGLFIDSYCVSYQQSLFFSVMYLPLSIPYGILPYTKILLIVKLYTDGPYWKLRITTHS